MSDTKPFMIQAAELITTRPFEMIITYFKNKRDEKKALVELLTDACFVTRLHLNKLNAGKEIPEEKQMEIAKYWSKVCAELMIAYPPISAQFHGKAVSWASVGLWTADDIKKGEENLIVINEFIKKLAES